MQSLENKAIEFIMNFELESGTIDVNYVKNNYEKYINMTESEINKLSKADCAKAQFVLYQYAIGIDKKIKRAKTHLATIKKELNRIYAINYNSYYQNNMPYELVIASIENNCPNNVSELADNVIMYESLICEHDETLAHINKLCSCLNSLAWSRGKE